MNYIENVYICLVAPVLVAIFCARGKKRASLIFLIAGMTTCLLSSYISTFLASLYSMDQATASYEISPMVEECMKLVPILFYLLVFEPDTRNAAGSVLMTSLGFATFENTCWMTQNGAANSVYLLIRGFGTGAMHVVCGMIISAGLLFLWRKLWLRAAGTLGLLSLAITYHAIYNLLVSQTGPAAAVGTVLPLLTIIFREIFYRRRRPPEPI